MLESIWQLKRRNEIVRFLILFGLVTLIFAIGILSRVNAADVDELLSPYENGDRAFERLEVGDLIVFWHQRTLDGAMVEKDQIVYQFDAETGQLLHKKMNWRDDLPEHVTAGISALDAESIAGGDPKSSTLYVISPESDVYRVDPTPRNPCWVVRTMKDNVLQIIIIDSNNGGILGYGIPPPYSSFSFSGPIYSYPCEDSWIGWYHNAENWFNMMEHSCLGYEWPSSSILQDQIQDTRIGMFYEIAHGGSESFANGCVSGSYFQYTTANDIESWIADYPEMPFAFIASCDGLCQTGDGSFSYEFRKGSMTNTATVGYCGMSTTNCATCWDYSIPWQDALFGYIYMGWAVKDAFDQAQADYPACAGTNSCMRFAGDIQFNGPYSRSGCNYIVGDVNGSDNYNGLDITYGVACLKGYSDPMCPFGSCPIPPCDLFFYCGDVNGSCSFNGLDITYGVNYFKGGPGPVPCPQCPPAN